MPIQVQCPNCQSTFTDRWKLNKHLREQCSQCVLPSFQHLLEDDNSSAYVEWNVTYPMQGCISTITATPKIFPCNNEKNYLGQTIPTLQKVFCYLVNKRIPHKWSYALEVTFAKTTADGKKVNKVAKFACQEYALSNGELEDIDRQLEEMKTSCVQRIDKFCNEGSGWNLESITKLDVNIFRVKLKAGACGELVVLPDSLKNKRCVMNIVGPDCFKWSILCALHHNEVADNPNRSTSYQQWENDYVFPDVPMVTAADITAFERTNPTLAVYAHEWVVDKKNKDGGNAILIRRPGRVHAEEGRRVHILIYKDHWMAVTNLNALYTVLAIVGGLSIKCDCCMATYYQRDKYEAHLPCHQPPWIQNECMPVNNPELKFKDHFKACALPDILYVDTESILEPCEANTHGKLEKHVPCAAGAYHVSCHAPDSDQYREFYGPDCIKELVDHIETLSTHLYQRNKQAATRVKANRDAVSMARYNAVTKCYLCDNLFDHSELGRKVFDHDHLTGAYRGAACQGCNTKVRQNRNTLVVAIHNFRGYDAHCLCLQGLGEKT